MRAVASVGARFSLKWDADDTSAKRSGFAAAVLEHGPWQGKLRHLAWHTCEAVRKGTVADMDPITVIMGALSLAGTLAKPISDQVIKDGYAGFKSLILHRFAEKDPSLETTLAKFEQKPEVWKEPIRDALQEAGVDKDQVVVDQATELVMKAEAAQRGITGGLVGQINAAGGKVTVIGGNVTTLNM